MSALEMSVSEVCCKAGDSTDFFNCYMLVTGQKSRWSLKSRENRCDVNQTVPIPIVHYAKIRILEFSTISWQKTG